MLSTYYHEPRTPGERDLRILDLIARQAADWIGRTHAETALRESETKFRTLADASTAVIWFLDPGGNCRYVNRPYLDFFGKSEEEVYGEGWRPLVHPDDAPAYIAETLDSIRERRPLHCRARVRRHDQEWRWIESHALPHFGENGRYLGHVGNSVDISDSLEASAVLRDSEERYRSLISQVKDYAIFSTDERGVVTSWNEGCQYVLGYPQQDFIGLDFGELFTPEDRAEGIPITELRQAAEAGTTRNDRWMTARGGRRFFAMGATSSLQDSAGRLIGFSTLMRDLTQMKISQDELVQHGASLERLVTERTDELEKTTERLRLSERMASLGTLSAGLGHDLGNLLLPLDVRLQLLLQADLPLEAREHVIGIQRCLEYLQRLSNGLRLLATDPRRTASTETTEICAWWNDVGILLKNVLPSGITFDQDLPTSELWVTIDRAGLTQAVFNLVQNAADALKERGAGRVRISAEKDPRTGSVVVRVADDGPGMTEETLHRCMEPYFSTKARGISTGMGLALVHGLVTAAGGRLEIDSAAGRGTRMSLILPEAPLEEHDGYRPRGVAIVDLKDARLGSFISGEARLLGFDVRKSVNNGCEAQLVVTDEHFVRNHTAGSGTRDSYLIVLGGPVTVRSVAGSGEIVVLGRRPEPETISQALRTAAEKIDAIRV
jgi:PAS domain S-box-containing protein